VRRWAGRPKELEQDDQARREYGQPIMPKEDIQRPELKRTPMIESMTALATADGGWTPFVCHRSKAGPFLSVSICN